MKVCLVNNHYYQLNAEDTFFEMRWKHCNAFCGLWLINYRYKNVQENTAKLLLLVHRLNVHTENFEKRPLLYNFGVPDGRDLRFASTGSNFNTQNTQCIAAYLVDPADRIGVFKYSPSLALNKIEGYLKV